MSISNKVIDIASSLEFVNDYNTVGITGSNARITASGTGNLTIYATSSSTNSSIGAVILQNGGLSINASTLATSTTAGGALTVAGGAAFAQNMFVGGGLNALGNANTIGNIFTTGGNVGINTLTPSAPLHITRNVGTGSVNPLFTLTALAGTDINGGAINGGSINLEIGESGGNVVTYNAGKIIWGTIESLYGPAGEYNGLMIFQTANNRTLGNLLTLTGNQRVGINTTNPSVDLDVNGTINATLFTSGNLSVTNSCVGSAVIVNANVTNNSITNVLISNETVSNSNISSVTSSNVFVTGTVSTANLRGTGVFATNMGASGVSTTTLLVTGSGTVGSLLVSGGGLVAGFGSNTVGSIFTTGGNVGIANTAPSYTLDVTGTFRVNGSGVSSIRSSTNSDVIQLQNANGTGNSAIQILDNSGTTRMNIGYGNTGGNAVYAGVGYVSANTGIPIKLIAGGRTADPVTLNASDNSVTINTTTSSVNQYSGALKVVGGTGIQENLFVGGNATVNLDLNVNGAINGAAASSSTFAYLTLTATDEAINLSTGSMVTFGGITIQATRDATDASNGGGLLIAGGASVGKRLFVGTSISTGAISVSGVVSAGTLAGNTVTSGNVAANSGTVASLLASNFSVGSLAISTLATAANVSALNVSVATLRAVNLTTGNINFTGTLSQNGVPYVGSQWVGTSGTISFGTAGTSLVGINTTSPAFALDVSGGARVVTGVTAGPSTFTTISSGNSNFTGITAGASVIAGLTTGNINFTGNLFQNGSPYLGSQWAGTSGNISYTRGNVGIGTTSASSTLTVVGDANISGITSLANLVATNTTIANFVVNNLNTGISSYFSGSFAGANNVTTGSAVTGLNFSSTDIRSFTAQVTVSVLRSTGGNSFETVTLEGYQTDAGWSLLTSSIGDISGITFSIDANGQVLYTSTNVTNWTSTTIRYSAQQISLNGNYNSLARLTTGTLVVDSLQLNNTSDVLLGSNNGALYSLGGAVFAKGLVIQTTNDATGIGTGGGLTILGGAAVSKSLVVGTSISSSSVFTTNITGTNLVGTTVSAGTLAGTNITSSSGTINNLIVTTASTTNMIANAVSTGTLLATTSISSGSIQGTNSTITNAVHTALSSGTLNLSTGLTTGTLLATTSISSGSIQGTNVLSTNATISNIFNTQSTMSTLFVSTGITTAGLASSSITAGTINLSGNMNIAGTLTVVNITTTNLIDTNVTATNVVGTTVSAGTLRYTNAIGSNETLGALLVTGGGIAATFNSNTLGSLVTTGGNVGTGTTSPSERLHAIGKIRVDNTGGAYSIYLDPSGIATAGPQLQFTNIGSTAGDYMIVGSYNNINNIDTKNRDIRIFNSAGNTLLYGSAAGNVGIGTTAPGFTLDVTGTARVSTGLTTGTLMITSSAVIPATTNNYSLTSGALGITGDTVISGNELYFTTAGVNPPTMNGRSSGTKIVLYPQTGVTQGDFSIGIESGNTWFQVPSSVQGYKFYQGTTASMIMAPSGVVGIGTTQPNTGFSTTIPNARLSLLSGVAGANGGTSRLSIGGDNSHYSAIEGAHTASGSTTLALLTCTNASSNSGNPLTRMFIDASGNVGIGTTSPSYTLHINNSYNTNGIVVGTGNTSSNVCIYGPFTDGWGYIQCGTPTTTGSLRICQFNTTNSTLASLQVYSAVSSFQGGNVGIGTTSPPGILSVVGSGNAGTIRVAPTSNDSEASIGFYANSGFTSGNTGDGWVIGRNSWGVGSRNFAIGGSVIGAVMTFSSQGNVGIGTTIPIAPLHVFQTAAGNNKIAGLFGNGGGGNTYAIETGAYFNGTIGTARLSFQDEGNYSSSINFSTKTPGSENATMVERMRITASGLVGIGTTSPAYTLQVSGTVYASGDVISYSDQRIKTDIVTVDNALDKVSQMRGVYYTNTQTQKRGVGVIAQEIQTVLPEVIEDKAEYLGVAYGNIIGVLVEAIKELKSQNSQLFERLKKLEQ